MNNKFYIRLSTLFLALLLPNLTGRAAAITVTNLNNSGAGSLRQMILDANPGDTIKFAANLKGSIQLTGELVLDKNLTINGPGANVLGVDGRSVPTESRVFNLTAGNAKISDLRISHGFSSGDGGGLWVQAGGRLTLNNCLIIGNEADSGGGVFGDVGSLITITNSTIDGNFASVGGGVSNHGGTLVLTNSLVIENIAQLGGVSVDNGGTATILNSTITQNGNNGGSTGEVSGRVLTSNGNGISKAQVSITDQYGETRLALTNAFGFYQFNEIPAGETYVMSVIQKRYQFYSRVITVSENIRDADFTAEP